MKEEGQRERERERAKERLNTYRLIDGTKDLIYSPNLRLVLQIDWCIKMWDFLMGELTNSISLTSMKKGCNFCKTKKENIVTKRKQ